MCPFATGHAANSPIKNYAQVTIYDGLIRPGTVAHINGRYITVDVEGHLIGEFATQRGAMRALPGRRA
jgi:hypothetical protein